MSEDFQKARDAEKGGVLLPYQKRWIEDKTTVKVMEKSRRVGISWAEAADDALYAASEEGDDVWYIGYNKDMAMEFIKDCGDWAKAYSLAAADMEEEVFKDVDKDILSYIIRFASGKRITALSSRPTNLRGKAGRVVIDEAAFHDDLDELIKAAIALTIWGGDVRIISTHDGDDNAFNDLVKDARAKKKPYSVHRVDFDEAIEEGLCRRIFQVLKRDWTPEAEKEWRQKVINEYGEAAQEELFVVPSKGGGTYLPRSLVESCMSPTIPVLRWCCPAGFAEKADHIREADCDDWIRDNINPILAELDVNQKHYFGEDFGRSGDLTAIWPLAEQSTLNYKTPFLVELRNVPFKQQEQILFHIIDNLPKFQGGALDARGNGQYLAEVAMQKYGKGRILEVMLSQTWYRDNMPRYKAAFEDKTITIPRHADVLEDHRGVKMDKGIAKVPDTYKTTGTDGGQRHGDTAIAGALAIFAVNEVDGTEPASASSEAEQGDYHSQRPNNRTRPGHLGNLSKRTRRLH